MMDCPDRAEDRERTFGWFAHMHANCARCGDALGPFGHIAAPTLQWWGCPRCGLGVLATDDDPSGLAAAADRYMAMVRS